MCFSAPVSFGAAALTGLAGIAGLKRVSHPGLIPLASLPLWFSLHQGLEGALWLTLPRHAPVAYLLANSFVVVAMVLWPMWIPWTFGLAENDRARRRLIFAFLPLAAATAAYGALLIWRHPYSASVVGSSLCYINGVYYSNYALAAYIGCVCAPPLLSRDPLLKLFGLEIACGLLVSLLFYFVTFVSVWCFFAAIASVTVLVCVERRRLLDLQIRAAC